MYSLLSTLYLICNNIVNFCKIYVWSLTFKMHHYANCEHMKDPRHINVTAYLSKNGRKLNKN